MALGSLKSTGPSLAVLQKQLAELEKKVGGSRTGPVLALTMTRGESPELVLRAWRKENPNDPEPEVTVLTEIFGALPRLELATEASIAEALPGVKAFLVQLGDHAAIERWRGLALLAGLDYDAAEMICSGVVH
ncbi:MAG: hypothetical protein ABI640_10810 [Gammaproteobacteria bacterium]